MDAFLTALTLVISLIFTVAAASVTLAGWLIEVL